MSDLSYVPSEEFKKKLHDVLYGLSNGVGKDSSYPTSLDVPGSASWSHPRLFLLSHPTLT